MRPAKAADRQQGFTLLEVIVALVIAGFALGAKLESLESGMAGSSRADHNLRALSIARSQLAAVTAMPALQPGTQNYAVADHFHSTVDIRQIALSGTQGNVDRLGLFSISVTVTRDGAARAMTLTGRTVRPAAVQE
ncbi:prepilin-type N-terminal cleavage/methylation domain-containing protein [Acetobacter musti]|uniref:Prepilin-type N-terminal cleavage/methylation domain-containing protein n=1 Tax=Acetobacter musti TaxID=864732 RepID=A0ABX0JUB2_9PROT|nr:type II secretion system protein [Acetobacter musti]NHN86419.1 prepilin-type N-terminal cleavage/methylation domain-containing protein [Acetobacter musti]